MNDLDNAPAIAQRLRESAAACTQEQCTLAALLMMAAGMLDRLYSIVLDVSSPAEGDLL